MKKKIEIDVSHHLQEVIDASVEEIEGHAATPAKSFFF